MRAASQKTSRGSESKANVGMKTEDSGYREVKVKHRGRKVARNFTTEGGGVPRRTEFWTFMTTSVTGCVRNSENKSTV